MDITYELEAEYGLPDGFYIRYIEIDSPAMNAGLQNGDILVSVNGEKFNTYHDFILWLAKEAPDTTVTVSLMRPSVDRYVPIEAEVTLGSISYIPEDE